jgi:dihydroneopterin aldolase/2-amino-4-hydroxy-6-hydroxymethyldihydropteridine diphosphokinase
LDTLDRIDLQGVEAWGRHGVFESEKTTRQLFRVDVALWLTRPDLDRARPDDVAHTVDYGLVADLVADLVTTSSFDLIETLADRLAMAILDLGGESAGAARTASSPAAVEVTVHKPQAPVTPPFADVAVTVRRRPRPRVRQVVFSLGSNLGDRAAWLRFGVAALATTPGIGQVEVSSVYESTAVGVEQQPDYLNLVVVAMSDLTAPALLERGLAIEWAAGRRRGGSPVAHGPRTLDIDLIAVGGELSATDYLTLPHPRAARRAFVLRPWLEVDPLAEVAGRPVADWLEDVTDQSIRHRPDFSILAADHG